MGKYDKLKSKLPAFQQEPTFQAKVDEAKSRYQALEATELVRTFNSERHKKKSFEEAIASSNIELEALSQLLIQNFEASGLSKLTLESGLSCYQQMEPYSSIQDLQTILAFIKKQKMQNLLTLQWQTMNALNKERLVEGKPPLPGTQVFLKTSIRLRNGSSETSEE